MSSLHVHIATKDKTQVCLLTVWIMHNFTQKAIQNLIGCSDDSWLCWLPELLPLLPTV